MKSNDMVHKLYEFSTYKRDNGIDVPFVNKTWLSVHGNEANIIELALSAFDEKSFTRQSRSRVVGIVTTLNYDLGAYITFKTNIH